MIKYCGKMFREYDGKTYYTDIFNSFLAVKMCGHEENEIYKIDVREAKDDEETPYFGWLDLNDGTVKTSCSEVDSFNDIHFIFPNRIQLEICFPYGTKPEIECGHGKIIKVFIKEVDKY